MGGGGGSGGGGGADGVYDEQVSLCKRTDAPPCGHDPLGPAPLCKCTTKAKQLVHELHLWNRTGSTNRARTRPRTAPVETPQACARNTVLLVHTLHDAEEIGPAEKLRNTAWKAGTTRDATKPAKPSHTTFVNTSTATSSSAKAGMNGQRPTPGMSPPLSKQDVAQFTLCVTPSTYPLSNQIALSTEINWDVISQKKPQTCPTARHRTRGCQILRAVEIMSACQARTEEELKRRTHQREQ